LAQSAEELAIRGDTAAIPDRVLGHLPTLGFPVPQEVALHSARPALYRYDKLRYVTSLHRSGEIFLRCASSPNVANDAARNDSDELCVRLRLLAEDLILDTAHGTMPGSDVVNLKIHQKTDYLMFCLSQVYDWRLFGDFGDTALTDDPKDQMACLVITDPAEFIRRFAHAIGALENPWAPFAFDGYRIASHEAAYYDPFDARECDTLFVDTDLLPFAKRREYTYQHEYRLIIRPYLPDGFVPDYPPDHVPRFSRAFLHLGSLEDISHIVHSEVPPPASSRIYLSTKEVSDLASAIGVTVPGTPDRIRFIYSVEKKELGRTSGTDLTSPKRYGGESMGGVHEQEIDVAVEPSKATALDAVAAFYRIFDIREHGNHLIEFQAQGPTGSPVCRYEAHLVCGEPSDDRLEMNSLTFHFKYSFRAIDGGTALAEEIAINDAETYWSQFNDVGSLHLCPTYRSLMVAEMAFLTRLLDRGISLIRYEVFNEEVGRCSELTVG
jgi:hypothetical protein